MPRYVGAVKFNNQKALYTPLILDTLTLKTWPATSEQCRSLTDAQIIAKNEANNVNL